MKYSRSKQRTSRFFVLASRSRVHGNENAATSWNIFLARVAQSLPMPATSKNIQPPFRDVVKPTNISYTAEI